jgi:hypothetical protein
MCRTTLIAILLVALGCAACGSGSSSSAADPPSTTAPTSSTAPAVYSGPTIPDGTYRHVLVAADVRRVGFPTSADQRILGNDGHEAITLKIQGLQWSEFETADNGTANLGDLGLFRYRPGHRVYMTSQSVGCPGCQQLWHWSADGRAVTLRLLKDTIDTVHDPRMVREIIEHTFKKVG